MLKERVLTYNKMKARDCSKKRNVGFSCPENSKSEDEALTGKVVKYKRSHVQMKKSYYLLDHVTSLQVWYCAPLRKG